MQQELRELFQVENSKVVNLRRQLRREEEKRRRHSMSRITGKESNIVYRRNKNNYKNKVPKRTASF